MRQMAYMAEQHDICHVDGMTAVINPMVAISNDTFGKVNLGQMAYALGGNSALVRGPGITYDRDYC